MESPCKKRQVAHQNKFLGAWISFALWVAIFILMLKERHHINSHLTDESMFGSEFGGSRRGMSSRMSNGSFDKMSQSRYSNYSGSQGRYSVLS